MVYSVTSLKRESAMLIQEKVSQAIDILKEFDIDCWITFVRETLLNGDPTLPFLVKGELTWHSALIITAGGRKHAIVGRYDRKGIEELGVYDHVVGYVEGIRKPFLEYLQELNPSSIAVNYSRDSEICDGLTHGMYLTLHDLLQQVGMADRIVSAEPIVSAMRERKTEAELKFIREAIAITEDIFREVTSFIRTGKTEREIASFMKSRVEARGIGYAWDPASCPAVFVGPETAEAHYGPTDRPVVEGQVLNMDFGVQFRGYCSDLQRTFYVIREGETSIPADVQKGFDTIVRAIES